MKNLALLIIYTTLLHPTLSMACEPTADQMEDYWRRSRANEEAYLTNLAREADQIFTGLVVDVTDLKDDPYVQLAHVKIETVLKGDVGSTATAKMWLRINPERDHSTLDSILSCDQPPDPAQNNPYVLKTYRYLYYVKGGVLLRANGFPLGPPPLEPDDEIKLLKRVGI